MMAPVVWFHLRDLSRSGVPISLLRYLRWAAAGSLGDFVVVAERPGPLIVDFEAIGVAVEVLEPDGRRSGADALAVGLAELGAPRWGRRARQAGWVRRLRRLPTPDVVVVHGLGGLRSAGSVHCPGVPVVVHVHELETGWRRSVGDDLALLRSARAVMAVCEPSADLCRRHGVSAERISVVPGSVDIGGDGWSARLGRIAARDRVVGIGSPEPRKGVDRFVALAHELRRSLPEVECHWIGGAPRGEHRRWVEAPDPVRWVGSGPRPWDHVALDRSVLVVPSREDPMPLVVLEAACRGVPVVATRTGGLTELLGSGRGSLADQNAESLAEVVVDLLLAPGAASRSAGALRAEVLRRYSTQTVGPTWWEVIDRVSRPAQPAG